MTFDSFVVDTVGVTTPAPTSDVNCLWAEQISPDDSRRRLWAQQRAERGFDDTEIWSLDQTIASFLASRLRAFRDHEECPLELYGPLCEMILGFETVVERGDGCMLDECEMKIVKKAFKLLRKNFFRLFI